MIQLANSPAGLRGPQAPRTVLLLLLFASFAGKKQQQKDRSLEGFALQTSQSGVSQQNDHYGCGDGTQNITWR
jgi:hypothetical protein